jgi:hypothetical protein
MGNRVEAKGMKRNKRGVKRDKVERRGGKRDEEERRSSKERCRGMKKEQKSGQEWTKRVEE